MDYFKEELGVGGHAPMEKASSTNYLYTKGRPSCHMIAEDSTLTHSTIGMSPDKSHRFESRDITSMEDQSGMDLSPLTSSQLQSSGNEKFRSILQKILNDKMHTVQILFTKFHIRFNNLFCKKHEQYNNASFCSHEDDAFCGDLYKCIKRIIRNFLRVTRKVVFWMYQDLISQAKRAWRDDQLSTSWVIDSILSGILFNFPGSTISKILRDLLVRKHSGSIRQLEKTLKKHYSLDQDEDFVQNYSMFLLSGRQDPYHEVVLKISELSISACPYSSFEIIASLEKEILACANLHYTNDLEMSLKLADKFDREVKVSVLIYCIMTSQNANLVVNVAMVEAFVSGVYLGAKQSFSSFCGVLSFLLNEDNSKFGLLQSRNQKIFLQ